MAAHAEGLALLLLAALAATLASAARAPCDSLNNAQPDDANNAVLPAHAAHAAHAVCRTAGCNRTAAMLAQSVNASADPCEDFFAFACGGYVASTPIPASAGGVNVIAQMEERLRAQIRDLLAEPAAAAEPAAFKKAKALYAACTDTDRLEELGLAPATKILDALGGWPLLEGGSWDEAKFDWKEMSYKMMDLGLYGAYLFTIEVNIDITNTTKHSLAIGMPSFNIDLKAFDAGPEKDRRLFKYLSDIGAAARMLLDARGARANMSDVTREALHTAFFEVDLNAGTQSLEDRQNVTLVTPMTVRALQTRYPYVPWLEYVRRLLPRGANVSEDEQVIVADPGYMDWLGQRLGSARKRHVANYMVWRALEEYVFPYLNADFRKVFVQGSPERAGLMGRWEECVKLVQGGMRVATSAMYVRRHSSAGARSTAREMVHDIRGEMRQLLQSVDWMDPSTKRAAMRKAEVMRYNVAFPDELLNDTLLDHYFEGLEIAPGRLAESVLALEKHAQRRSARRFGTAVKKQDWTLIAGVADLVNAYYNHAENSMSIPAAILQERFFQKDRPQYMNYGAIGFAIAHEVSHGFDETGSLFNVDGMMEDWCDARTKRLFDERVSCMVEQYAALRDKETNLTVNGLLTRSENIADNAGLRLAYRAYRRYTERHGEELRLDLQGPQGHGPGARLKLKARQLFWVAFASVWCSKESSKELYSKLRTSAHLPGIYRVNGAVRNQEAFAADFNCPAGSPMNPAHKCQIW